MTWRDQAKLAAGTGATWRSGTTSLINWWESPWKG